MRPLTGNILTPTGGKGRQMIPEEINGEKLPLTAKEDKKIWGLF